MTVSGPTTLQIRRRVRRVEGIEPSALSVEVGGQTSDPGELLPGIAADPIVSRTTDRAILVVDDDASIRAAIRDVLESEGYRVVTASDGAAALSAIERERPAMVLLDMRMPVLDGWGFSRELRRRGISLPICVMTAARDAARWASEIGADSYLAKPFNLTDLLDQVERLGPTPQP